MLLADLMVMPLKNNVDFLQILQELMKFGEKIGLTKEQIAEAVKVITKERLLHYYHAIDRLTDPDEVMKVVGSFVINM